MDIRFLWIDSLCIIQDSKTDWEQESSQMGLIYGNGCINIAADAAEDGDQGFLPVGKSLCVPYTVHVADGGLHGQLWLKPAKSKRLVLYSGNLRRRGWVLQEYVLSPCSLRYSRDGVRWECRQESKYQEDLLDEENSWRRETRELKSFPSLLDSIPPLSKAAISEVMTVWRKLISEYSRKQLTRETDKLPAVSGLAARIRDATGETYLAGLWACDLPMALQWQSENPVWRAREYYAPSWSWASCGKSCPIIYPASAGRSEVTILDASITPAGTDPLGSVSDGFIKLEGLVQKAAFKMEDPVVPSSRIVFGPEERQVCRYLVSEITSPRPQKIWCLLLATACSTSDPHVFPTQHVLIVEEVEPQHGVFRRLTIRNGLPSYEDNWKGAERRILTII